MARRHDDPVDAVERVQHRLQFGPTVERLGDLDQGHVHDVGPGLGEQPVELARLIAGRHYTAAVEWRIRARSRAGDCLASLTCRQPRAVSRSCEPSPDSSTARVTAVRPASSARNTCNSSPST